MAAAQSQVAQSQVQQELQTRFREFINGDVSFPGEHQMSCVL
jgi:hypothetical protein